jgi:DNA (cytosine-5)-methyltransferase 1
MSVTATDLFCGAGGSSIGFELAGGKLRLGLNHWPRAVETHEANFQDADHDCEDVASLTTAQIRRYPDSDILIASPECTNHSLAKGARRIKPQSPSENEDGPPGSDEQERSRATMWDVVRFAEQKQLRGRPYKAIVVENVVDAFKWGYNDDGGLFKAWRFALANLGYDHEIVYLNSMFCPPVPQSRDRMYVVFWLKGLRRPNLRFEPIAWCSSCSSVVAGRQRFKRLDREPWGRYGQQYVYSCPQCSGTVFPGAFPAMTIIDSSIQAPRIGDRARPLAKNTRERIRRGLERLQSEPFAIRLLQGGNPRPLTLPIVTLTQRHDMAMVTPVGGNTFERTPGNRARDVRRQPLDTVHCTPDRALVIAPMGSVAARPANTLPAPTQTTTTRSALVMANTENGVPRPAREQPTQTLRTEGGLALVMGNRMHGVPRRADLEPGQTVCTGETLAVVQQQKNGGVKELHEPVHTVRTGGGRGGYNHAVVVANYHPGWARDAQLEPTGSLTTTDSHALLVPYQRGNDTVVADREPAGTLTTRDGFAVVWTDDEIDDCGFRMFALHEIGAAMAMIDHPAGGLYELVGNKRERMAQYGNAVTPPVMRALVERILPILDA